MKFRWWHLILFVICAYLLGGWGFLVVFVALVGYNVLSHAGTGRSERHDDDLSG
jgi:hypothetical protein